LWFAASDGLGSIGKMLFGLRCVDAKTGKDCTVLQSLLRNAIFIPSLVRAELRVGEGSHFSGASICRAARRDGRAHRRVPVDGDARRSPPPRDALGDTRVVLRGA